MTIRSLLIIALLFCGGSVQALTEAEGRQCVQDVINEAQARDWSLMQAAEHYIDYNSIVANALPRSSHRGYTWQTLPEPVRDEMIAFAQSFFRSEMYDANRTIDPDSIVLGRVVSDPSGAIDVSGRFRNEHDQFEPFNIWVTKRDGRCVAVDLAYQNIRFSSAVGRQF
jgi:hypothetical protein